jgi:hypothetical protein
MKSKKEQKVPKWFDGEVYTEGDTVRNPYSGETYELNGLELSIYDLIIGAQHLVDAFGGPFNKNTIKFQQEMRKGLDWFRSNNVEAYYILLD